MRTFELQNPIFFFATYHSVSGHDNDRFGRCEFFYNVFGRHFRDGSLRFIAAISLGFLGRRRTIAETTEQYIANASVHGVTHDERQDDPGASNKGTGDDQGLVGKHESGSTSTESR